MAAPVLFDRSLRRLRRDRALRSAGDVFLHQHAFDGLLDRLGDVRRRLGRTLLIGCADPSWPARLVGLAGEVLVSDPSPIALRPNGGVVADEDRLPFADASFDLVVAVGTLDGLDDLPGALHLVRRILLPDGLFLGAMAAAGSLPRLRDAMLAADAVRGGASPRMHPAVDVRTAGDLLARAGFALPVADGEGLDVSYPGLMALIADLRGHGVTNILHRRSPSYVGRQALAAAVAAFAQGSVDGRTTERIELVYLSGWRQPSTPPTPTRRVGALEQRFK